MKIVAYCALWAIVLALFIAMCVILRNSVIPNAEGKVAANGVRVTNTIAPAAAMKQ